MNHLRYIPMPFSTSATAATAPLLETTGSDRPAPAREIERTTRSALEHQFGWWSDDPELVEDGRATSLSHLPRHGTLYLARTGDVVAVHRRQGGGHSARVFSGSPGELWAGIANLYPGVAPGMSFPRFRVIREPVSVRLDRFGVFDLASLSPVGWTCSRGEAHRIAAEGVVPG